ncbi:hypothetical protein NQ315_017493 [Exocentrus adspersus]|uniref:DUF7869 domain-containing protein n=1 Tax=Exocentrus adspersus TaxID=1586481 RepID=A0AAV8VJP9_9CUCU|nr:hypothetical protein NQ315_017493 [Exocentrus adspersus]
MFNRAVNQAAASSAPNIVADAVENPKDDEHIMSLSSIIKDALAEFTQLEGIPQIIQGDVNSPISMQDENILLLSSTTGIDASTDFEQRERIPQEAEGDSLNQIQGPDEHISFPNFGTDKETHSTTSPIENYTVTIDQCEVDNVSKISSQNDSIAHNATSDQEEPLSEPDPYETDSGSDYVPQQEEYENSQETDTDTEERQNENRTESDNGERDSCETTEKRRTRKRLRNENEWRRNKIKRLRNSGKMYKNWKNNLVSARKMRGPCTCILKCSTKFTEENRKIVFDQYWGLGNIDRQRDFISKHVKFLPKSRCRLRADKNEEIAVNSRRNYTYIYNLPHLNGAEEVRVVKTVAQKCMENNVTIPADKRGKVKKNSQLPEEVKESVRQHISSFVPVESHYCRKDSNRLLLPPTLNVAKMYDLYKEFCESNNISHIASSAVYRQIFNCEFNISFLVPKKDQCDIGNTSVQNIIRVPGVTADQKNELQDEYNFHIKTKDLAREYKNKDKEKGKNDKEFCVAVFDLEQILPVPKSEVGLAYYKLKLSTYNFTIFNLASKDCSCYMWHEGIAKRGASEIGSCLILFIDEQVKKGIKEFSFYSDNCSGQNRNKYLYSLYNYLTNKHTIKIRHSYLEKGHTQNEGDSVHSLIERASKNIPIYLPDQWYTLVRTAKRSNPQYKVQEMAKEFIFDLKDLQLQTTLNWDKDINNEKVKWQKIKIIETNPRYPDTILFKYEYEASEYNRINLLQKGRKRMQEKNDYLMKPLYRTLVPIKKKKYEHLLFLCNKLVIPSQYHDFFQGLPYSENVLEFWEIIN